MFSHLGLRSVQVAEGRRKLQGQGGIEIVLGFRGAVAAAEAERLGIAFPREQGFRSSLKPPGGSHAVGVEKSEYGMGRLASGEGARGAEIVRPVIQPA
jgi:hypothetical protein